MQAAAITATALLVLVAVFQLALALGAPMGRAAWGGRHSGVLPARFRVASAVTGLALYPAAIALIQGTAGLLDADRIPGTGAPAMWALTGVFALGALANLASPSRVERLWSPVALGIALCCAVIALGG